MSNPIVKRAWSVERKTVGCFRTRRLQWQFLRNKNTGRPRLGSEVHHALLSNKPIVALETAIYTHGFPFPENITLALELEDAVRAGGAIPAHIGLIDGSPRVGLDEEQLRRLCNTPRDQLMKVSRRDLSLTYHYGSNISSGGLLKPLGRCGGTTVAGTMVLAHQAGIQVFATGGIGGVHRGAESSFDISADLVELGRTPVAVVCSGCKSFLDIPKTLEFLETQGVPVVTIDRPGAQGNFPAFWSSSSGIKSPALLLDPSSCDLDQIGEAAARVTYLHFKRGLQTGLLFANPIAREHEIPRAEMEFFINEAIRQADAERFTGKDNTPFILSKIKELSQGRSVVTNRELVLSNARVAATIARRLKEDFGAAMDFEDHEESNLYGSQKIEEAQDIYEVHPSSTLRVNDFQLPEGQEREGHPSSESNQAHSTADSLATADHGDVLPDDNMSTQEQPRLDIAVAGSLAVDYCCDYTPIDPTAIASPQLATSNPASITQTIGGVGYNVAKAAHLMGAKVQLFSAVGDDMAGTLALDALSQSKMQFTEPSTVLVRKGRRTAQYMAVNDAKKDLVLGMADMSIMEIHNADDMKMWAEALDRLRPKHLVVDTNWSPTMLRFWASTARRISATLHIEPVSAIKAIRVWDTLKTHENANPKLQFSFGQLSVWPNESELTAIYSHARDAGYLDTPEWWDVMDGYGLSPSGSRDLLVRATNTELVNNGIPQMCLSLLPYFPRIVVKLGAHGVLEVKICEFVVSNDSRQSHVLKYLESKSPDRKRAIHMKYAPANSVDTKDVISVNGVGDTLMGAALAATVLHDRIGSTHLSAVEFGQRAAIETLKSNASVSETIADLWTTLRAGRE